MQKAGGKAILPPFHPPAKHIVDLFVDLGFVHSGGLGLAKLPYSEIVAGAPWADAQERKLIRDMSGAYLDGRAIGEDPFGISPAEQAQDG